METKQMSRKASLLAAACIIPLLTCFVIFNNIRSVDSTRAIPGEEARELRHFARALIASNITDQVALNETLNALAAPVSGVEPSAPNSSPPPSTPAAAPPPSPAASSSPSTPVPLELPPSVVFSPVSSPASSPSVTPTKLPGPEAPQPMTTGPLVVPILDCIVVRRTGEYRAYFSYENKGSEQVSVPVGLSNKFTAPVEDVGQPIVFAPGRSANFPASVFTTVLSDTSAWQLTSYELTVRPADRSIHCREDIKLVLNVNTTLPLNISLVDAVTQVVAVQLNVSTALVNSTIDYIKEGDYGVNIVVKPPIERLEELLNAAKEVISDPSLIEKPLKNLIPDAEVTSVRGAPNTQEQKGVYVGSTVPSYAHHLAPAWILLLVFLVNFD